MKTYRVEITAAANEDYRDISAYLLSTVADDVALSALEQLEAAVESLAESPERGRRVQELRSEKHVYRELVQRRYRIIYRVEANSVYVVVIADHRRSLGLLFDQRIRRDPSR